MHRKRGHAGRLPLCTTGRSISERVINQIAEKRHSLPQYGAPKFWTKPEVLKIAIPVGASKTLFIKENPRQTCLRGKPGTDGMNYALYLSDRSGTASHGK